MLGSEAYGTAKFEVYTCVWVHACACTFTEREIS